MLELILLTTLLIILFTILYAALSAAPWLPTKRKDIKRVIELAHLKPGEVVYDLGCGDGRLLIEAYKNNPKIKIIGVEISILFYLISKLNFLLHKVKGRVVLKDLFKVNLSGADVVFVYLMPKSYERLKNKFERELKPGTKIIVGVWSIPGWGHRLVKHDRPDDKNLSLYVYEFR